MNHPLAQELDDVFATPGRVDGLAYEGSLRVAAQTLRYSAVDDVAATTVVGVVGADDLRAFERLVAEIADELDLDARVRLRVGSFLVRFSRRLPATAEPSDEAGLQSLLARLLPRSHAGT
jgi:hypothetical protein